MTPLSGRRPVDKPRRPSVERAGRGAGHPGTRPDAPGVSGAIPVGARGRRAGHPCPDSAGGGPRRTPTDEPDTRLRRAVTGELLFLSVLGAGAHAPTGSVTAEVGRAIWVPLLLALLPASPRSCSPAGPRCTR